VLKPPAKPQSLVKCEEAIDKEIERITKRISENLYLVLKFILQA